MQVVPLGVHAPDDFDAAFAAMTEKPPDAILMATHILTVNMPFSPMTAVLWPTAPIWMRFSIAPPGSSTKILKGASPAELPLELPTRSDLAVNLETAKTTTTAAVAGSAFLEIGDLHRAEAMIRAFLARRVMKQASE